MLELLEKLPIEERQELQRCVEVAEAANELLNNPLVISYFKNQVDSIFNDFCELDLACSLKDYRSLHMRLISFNNLRLMLEANRQKGEQVEAEARRLSENDYEY